MTVAEPTVRVLLVAVQVTDLSLVPGARLGTPVDAADTAGQVTLNYHAMYRYHVALIMQYVAFATTRLMPVGSFISNSYSTKQSVV